MASPDNENWWSVWLDVHGRDSEEEAAFLGYLSEQQIPAHSANSGELDAAYAEFKVFMAKSQATPSADPGPPSSTPEPMVPVSHVADSSMQRPTDDATHPQQMSSPGAPASARQQQAAQSRREATPVRPSDKDAEERPMPVSPPPGRTPRP